MGWLVDSTVVVDRLKLPQGIWNLPRPGTEPGSPALDGGFLTSRPSEKSPVVFFFFFFLPNEKKLEFLIKVADYKQQR